MPIRRKKPLPYPNCGRNIKKYRKMAGQSISDFAPKIGISAKYLSSLESCYQMPSITTLDKIASELHVTIERLLKDNPDQENDQKTKELIIETLDTLTNDELLFFYHVICKFTQLLNKRQDNPVE